MTVESREKRAEPPVFELVDPSYRPSKAELDEEIDFREVVEGKSEGGARYRGVLASSPSPASP